MGMRRRRRASLRSAPSFSSARLAGSGRVNFVFDILCLLKGMLNALAYRNRYFNARISSPTVIHYTGVARRPRADAGFWVFQNGTHHSRRSSRQALALNSRLRSRLLQAGIPDQAHKLLPLCQSFRSGVAGHSTTDSGCSHPLKEPREVSECRCPRRGLRESQSACGSYSFRRG